MITQALAHTAHPTATVGHWNEILEGRWTLTDRFDSDGRRTLVARENSPTTRKLHALTDNERSVVTRIARCRPSKVVAYELGLAESTVSELLKNALRKLGARSRAELVDLYCALGSRR